MKPFLSLVFASYSLAQMSSVFNSQCNSPITIPVPIPVTLTTPVFTPISTAFPATITETWETSSTRLGSHYTLSGPSLTSLTTITSTPNSYSNNVTANHEPTIVPTLSISTLPSKVLPLTGITHTMDVGLEGQLTFTPNNITAGVRDMVFFFFHKLNHTLTQSTMDPCTSAEMFDSGFGYFSPLDQSGIINQALSFLVRDSEPSWFYCKQEQPLSHCEAGMVFGINVGDKMGSLLAKAQSSNHSATPSHSVVPIYINKTTSTGSSSEVTRKDGPLNTNPFVSGTKKLRADPGPSITYLIFLGAIGDGLGLFLF